MWRRGVPRWCSLGAQHRRTQMITALWWTGLVQINHIQHHTRAWHYASDQSQMANYLWNILLSKYFADCSWNYVGHCWSHSPRTVQWLFLNKRLGCWGPAYDWSLFWTHVICWSAPSQSMHMQWKKGTVPRSIVCPVTDSPVPAVNGDEWSSANSTTHFNHSRAVSDMHDLAVVLVVCLLPFAMRCWSHRPRLNQPLLVIKGTRPVRSKECHTVGIIVNTTNRNRRLAFASLLWIGLTGNDRPCDREPVSLTLGEAAVSTGQPILNTTLQQMRTKAKQKKNLIVNLKTTEDRRGRIKGNRVKMKRNGRPQRRQIFTWIAIIFYFWPTQSMLVCVSVCVVLCWVPPTISIIIISMVVYYSIIIVMSTIHTVTTTISFGECGLCSLALLLSMAPVRRRIEAKSCCMLCALIKYDEYYTEGNTTTTDYWE